MKINRDNYEEYFLLYADNELTAEMRQEVEWFVQENPDLKAELDIFEELKIHPDTNIGLGNKSFLRKESQSFESATEEAMLLHLDGELEAGLAQKLEAEIAADDKLAKSWEILQKTKLPAEPLAFPHKESLYREETRVVRLFQMQWVRYAAAAAVILISGLFWLSQSNQETSDVVGGLAQQVDGPKDSVKKDASRTNTDSFVSTNENTVQGPPVGNEEAVDNQPENVSGSNKGFVSLKDKSPARQAVTPGRNLIQQTTVDRVENQQAQETLIAQTLDNRPVKPVVPEVTDQAIGSPDNEIRADYATRALMDGDQPETDSYEAGQPTRKGPLRGIVRKANRIFHKVTNPDMDKPLVKVASFEIALAN